MRTIAANFLAFCSLCTALTGCSLPPEQQDLTATVYGLVQQVNEQSIVLQPGEMQQDGFVPQGDPIEIDLSQQNSERLAQMTNVSVGTVVRVTLSADESDEGFDIHVEALQPPSDSGSEQK